MTETAERHQKRIRRLPDGEIGITIGQTEYAMPAEEAASLASRIISVWVHGEDVTMPLRKDVNDAG